MVADARVTGTGRWNAKLTAAAVMDIRSSPESLAALARRYGVCPRTVRDARDMVTWKRLARHRPGQGPRASAVMAMTGSEWMRFWSTVAVSVDGCWLWTGSLSRFGYGLFRVQLEPRRQVVMLAHRVALSAMRGIAPDLLALHSCDRPQCVNPWHLRWGTQAENRDDCARRWRTGVALLSPERVMAIRAHVESTGDGVAATSRALGVSRYAVRNVISGRCYRHVS